MIYTRSRCSKPERVSEPSERQGGTIVPGAPRSPSRYGSSSSRAAGEEEELATASARVALNDDSRNNRPSVGSGRSAEAEPEDVVLDISDDVIVEDGREVDVRSIRTSDAIPKHIGGQVEVQTLGGTSVSDIILTQEEAIAELKAITADIKRDLNRSIESDKKKFAKKNEEGTRRKRLSQKEKKRKRDEEAKEEDTDEDEINLDDGEKVFLRTKTSRMHYLQVLQKMKFIKDMPASSLLPMMADWILSCEDKRNKSKNINGMVTRQMREYLIKLYCALGEIQEQKECTEAESLRKQLQEMRSEMEKIQEENRNLRKELEQIKNKINKSPVTGKKGNEQTLKSLNKSKDKDKRRKETGEKNDRNSKRKSRAVLSEQKEERIAELEENSITQRVEK